MRRKAVRAGSPAGVLRDELGAAFRTARWHESGPHRLRAGYGVGDATPPDAGPLGAVVARLAMNLRHKKPAMAMRIILRMRFAAVSVRP